MNKTRLIQIYGCKVKNDLRIGPSAFRHHPTEIRRIDFKHRLFVKLQWKMVK